MPWTSGKGDPRNININRLLSELEKKGEKACHTRHDHDRQVGQSDVITDVNKGDVIVAETQSTVDHGVGTVIAKRW